MTIILVTTFPMTACNKENADNSVKKITLCEVTHSIFYAPQYVAIENGYFADEGLELTVTNGFGADKVMTALISGDADIGFMGSESSIYVYAEGSDDYAVNFAGLTQRAGNFLVGREANDNFEWSELKGKTVINDTDCCILGFVVDIDFDPSSGCILALIVPGPARLCGLLGRDYEYVIPFKCIRTIGPDIILVSICPDKVKQKCI